MNVVGNKYGGGLIDRFKTVVCKHLGGRILAIIPTKKRSVPTKIFLWQIIWVIPYGDCAELL